MTLTQLCIRLFKCPILKLNCFAEVYPHSSPDEDFESSSDVSTLELGTFSSIFRILMDSLLSLTHKTTNRNTYIIY